MKKLFAVLSIMFGFIRILALASRPRTFVNPPRPRF
jgi:hypothetical protein